MTNKSKALPREERSYPQTYRCFNTQTGIHPNKTNIDLWIPYTAFNYIWEEYISLFKLYKRTARVIHFELHELSKYSKDPAAIIFFKEDIPFEKDIKDWVPHDDYSKLIKRYNRLYLKTIPKLKNHAIKILSQQSTNVNPIKAREERDV